MGMAEMQQPITVEVAPKNWLKAFPVSIALWIGISLTILTLPALRNAEAVPVLPVAQWISDGMSFVLNDFTVFGIEFKSITRAIADFIDAPSDFLRGALSLGFEFDWGRHYVELPPLSWVGLAGIMIAASWAIGGRSLGIFSGVVAGYLLIFNLWSPAALTFASVLLAVPMSAAAGLVLGIAAYRSVTVKTILTPILDLMQTVPIFAYMVPVLLLFGFGSASAIAATMIYATPPMVRATLTGLEKVPPSVIDLGRMVGASQWTTTWAILIPSARPMIMVGFNQVIMNSLNMVIIASMIGAGGLGFEVLDALRKLQLGQGAEAGIAITLIAILLDRLSQRAASSNTQPARVPPWVWVGLVGMTAVLSLLGYFVPTLAQFPSEWTTTTAPAWSAVMGWLNIHAFGTLNAIKVFVLTYFMFPLRDQLLAAPWFLIMSMTAWVGYKLSGIKTALLVAALLAFILFAGIWDLAMITLYLCGVGVMIAFLGGAIVAVTCYRNPRRRAAALLVADLLQTLPSFVYLIPVVMLFRVGDFAAVIAIAAYAIAPAIRYTIHGLVNVASEYSDVAKVTGCTPGQELRKIEIPLAVPEILLGLNQTIMMGLAMVVIAALVGTNDLGQEVYIALAKVDPGRGIVAGLGVAFIAMVLDRIVSGAAAEYKRKAIGS